MEEEVRNAILKVALGCSVEEVTEEYGVTDGELTLVKRRETRKDIPPDLKAVRLRTASSRSSSGGRRGRTSRPISKPCAFSWKGRTLQG